MRFLIAASGIVLSASAALSAEVPAISNVSEVTVFLSGAEVTRFTKVKLDKGEHTIVIGDLPVTAVPGSIRVEGKATGKLDIGSVDSVRKMLQRADSLAADEQRKQIEAQIEQLKDQKTAVDAQIQAAETQKALIANLAQLPTRPAPTTGVLGAGDDWPKVLGLITQATVDAARLALDGTQKSREIDRRITDLENSLGNLAPRKTEQTEVRVHVVAQSPLDADLSIRYQVAEARWAPIYDARLETGTKTTAPKLAFSRRAAISQRTGENWTDVALELSTARPSDGASVPGLETQIVDFEPEAKPAPPPAPLAAARQKRAAFDAARRDADETEMAAASVQSEPVPVQEEVAELQSAPFEATFNVPGRTSVIATGEAKRVLLMTEDIEPTLSSRSVPKLESNAYLYAKIKFAKGTPLLPGEAYLFRDGTFVGTGSIPLLSPGESHDLGFGVDDQVKVKYAILEEKRGETGLISTSHVDSRNFRVSVKNLHERPIDVTILDRVPVSGNDEIKVELSGKDVPDRKNVEDKRGLIAFDDRLEPDEEKVLEYGYRISWPAAKSIVYGP